MEGYRSSSSIPCLQLDGFLFWRVAKHLPEPPWGLIHLSLADETFGITRLPDSVDPVLPEAFTLDELHGQLCMTDFSHAQTVTIWTLAVQEDGGPRPMLGEALRRPARRFLPSVGISSRWTNIMVSLAFQISIYDMATAKLTTECQMDRLKYEGRRARTWKNLFYFNVRTRKVLFRSPCQRVSIAPLPCTCATPHIDAINTPNYASKKGGVVVRHGGNLVSEQEKDTSCRHSSYVEEVMQ